MGINSISFWQQNQDYWARAQKQDQSLAQSSALMNVIGNAMTTLSQGLASIANQTALSRVNTQLSAAVQGALNPNSSAPTDTQGSASSSSTSSSSSTAASSSSSATPAPAPLPAIGTGTVPLTATTPLLSLGIVPSGAVKVSDGTFTTTYTSAGSDTVGDLVNALNATVPGHANVAAWLNASGHLVISAKNNYADITVSGGFASNVGFGPSNSNFVPTVPPSSAAVSSSSSSTGSASSSTSPSSGSSSASAPSFFAGNSALALQSGGTAEILLASSGSAGSLLNLLA